jgi:hypothetical protein
MKSYWVTHRGKRIFISDFSNLEYDVAAVHEECEAIKVTLADEPPKSILGITNIEGTYVNKKIVGEFRQLLPITNKYAKRRAVIGLNGFRRHFVFFVSKVVGDVDFRVFDSLNEAQDWIVQD